MEEALVSAAIRAIGNPLLKEAELLVGAKEARMELLQKMKEMKCLLRDADRKQHQSKSVRNWLAEIRDLSYRAADVTEALAVWSLPSHSLATEIKCITLGIEKITASMIAHGISSSIINGDGADAGNNQDYCSRKTFPSFQMGDCFVGKEDQLKRLVSLVLDNKLDRVISVWGMSGIGKTTIVKNVYNRMISVADDSFDAFVWVCITRKCEIRSVLEDVLKQLNPEKVEEVSTLSETQLIDKLCEIQRDKRCLIVIDDIWETSDWDGLKHAFLDQDSKSKILVTTRKLDVAKIGLHMELGLLDEDDACELLKKKAFPGGNIPDFPHQGSIGLTVKQMVKKCGYLPLAICLLGGILSEKNLEDWESMNKNMDKYLAEEGKDNELDAVLKLSYDDLPYYLKPCFLYLGVLKEDESIHAGVLYRMWIAQGMISDESSRGNKASLMDIAECYLRELASRSIVQVEVDDGVPTKKYKTCKLHDAVRNSCLSIGRSEDYCVRILEYEGGGFSAFLENALSRVKTRHLVIYCKKELEGDDEKLTVSGDEDNSRSLRSLHIRNDIKGRTTDIEFARKVDFRKFKSLRSLAFEGFKFAKGKLLKRITNLVHLRHLCLRNCEIEDELPSSTKDLASLDTLDLYYNDLEKVPRLKHLLLPHYHNKFSGDRLRLDEGLDELECPMNFNSSVELNGVTKMKKLQHFPVHVHDNGSFSSILSAIDTKSDKLVNSVVTMEEGCRLTPTALQQVFTCRNLYNLTIYARVGKLPTEFSDIIRSNLASLTLSECEIQEDPMETLGNLPYLTELIFITRSFVGEEMTCCASIFPCLRILKLMSLPNLKQWRVEGGAKPLLSELHICGCRGLEMVPEGLSAISTTLQKLVIKAMPSGEDFDKVHHNCTIIGSKNSVLTQISNENRRGNEASSMDVAELYLSELASRSIVQIELYDGMPTKRYGACKLHDVVRELCLSMGEKENYRIQILEYEGGGFSSFLDDALSRIETQHLVVYLKTELQQHNEFRVIGEADNSKHLRSLHFHNGIEGRKNIEFPSKVDFRKFKSLRSVVFAGFKFARGKLPRGITRLVHLRNLRFRSCEIDELPSSISNLVYLEILDMLNSCNTRIPNVLKKMFRLKQLLLPRYDGARVGDYRLRLDKGLDQLESLMGYSSSVHQNSCVTRMKRLRRFSAYIHDSESFSAILNAIATNWNKLVYSFVIVEEGCRITSAELRQAFTSRNLHCLAIHAHLGKLVAECRSDIIGSNIVSLCLANCRIEETFVP